MELDQIKNLFNELIKNPEKVNELNKEQIEAIRRHNNPYGPNNRNDSANGAVCLSVTNLQEKFLIKLMMVAMTSFMFRMQKEYNVENSYRMQEDEYVPKPSRKTELTNIAIPDNNAYIITRADEALKEYYHPKNEVFDLFARVHAATESKKDDLINNSIKFHNFVNRLAEEKDKLAKLTEEIMENNDKGKGKKGNPLKIRHKKLREEINELEKEYNILIKQTSDALDSFNNIKADSDKLLEKYIGLEIKRFLNFYYKYNPKIHLRLDRDPIGNDKYRKEINIDPETNLPVDVFHNFQLYFDANYDELLKETQVLYALKPELENTITIWEDGFPDKEAAQEFINKNKDIFTVQILNIEKGKPYFYSSYSANRDKLQYYNENTEILQAIETRSKEEAKIGNELLKKRVNKIKSENIEKEGETSEAAIEYLKENTSTAGSKDYSVIKDKEVQHIPVHSMDRKGNMTTNTVYVEAEGDVINLSDRGKITTAKDVKKAREEFEDKVVASSSSSSSSIESHKNKRLEAASFDD